VPAWQTIALCALSPKRNTWGVREHPSRRQTDRQTAAAAAAMPIESAPPFIIITVMIAAMGLIQGGVHKAAYGKPKATGQDAWDRLNAARDARIREEGAQVSDCTLHLGLILTSSVHALTGAETMTGA
jgi:NADH-ubiquinone oxidoreductase MWFE subunit